jgi:Spy/CpxP family protein refolding chaperone
MVGALVVKNAPAVVASPAPRPANPPANPWQIRNRDLLRRMDRELALTPDQHAQIEKFMTGSQERTQHLWEPIAQEMNKETVQVCDEIREVLTPEQRTKFDTLLRPRRGEGPGNGERGRRRGPGGTNAPGTNRTSITNPPL